MTTSNYQWTTDSALYQLRWEPSERRASAVSYLTEVITTGPEHQVRAVAYALLSLNTESTVEVPHLPTGADYPLTRSAGGYRDDLRLLVQLIPEEVQNDDSYFAAQRLLSLVNATEVMTSTDAQPENRST